MEKTSNFLVYLDTYGRHRYFETPYYTKGQELISLDRAVWDVRRYARSVDYSIKTFEGNDVNLLAYEIEANELAEKYPPHRSPLLLVDTWKRYFFCRKQSLLRKN